MLLLLLLSPSPSIVNSEALRFGCFPPNLISYPVFLQVFRHTQYDVDGSNRTHSLMGLSVILTLEEEDSVVQLLRPP